MTSIYMYLCNMILVYVCYTGDSEAFVKQTTKLGK